MNLIMETVKNLLFFLIFASLIEQLFSGSSYKKYVQLFLGALSVLILLAPLLALIG